MNIIIMRHGEAINQAPTDSQRPLSTLGEQQCIQVGAWLAQEGQIPTHVWVSPYLRARQSWECVQKGLDVTINADIKDTITPMGHAQKVALNIYQFLHDIHHSQEGINGSNHVTLMIISHLPLVGYLVETLCPNELTPIMFATANLAGIHLSEEGEGELLWHGGLIKE